MKITELKIKENISPDVVAEAIEYISNACFIGGTYNPYYQGFAEKMAIVQYFLDGIEFEDGDSLFVACELEDVRKLINKFYGDKRFSEQSMIMDTIRENVNEVVDFKKQRLIHGADAIEAIAKMSESFTSTVDSFNNFITDLDIALGNLVKLDLDSISKEDVETTKKLLEKMANGDISQVIKDAVSFDIDKASQEIIDAKNKQIEELKKRNEELEKEHNARNVIAFKKEVDE